MKVNVNALRALELKLDEYSKINGSIAKHDSSNTNCVACDGSCRGDCVPSCYGSCKTSCSGSCYGNR
ncbi:MAG: hypothetical protein IKI08_07680 [Selenomonadaceae bacterium]|nr:hypothetical protein [Selenomonadaceae bacterium]MBR7025865.1 hypothetical protein [Selenomonadaceae bacterium]